MVLNSDDLVEAAVENSCGKVVGIVNDVMVDSDGHAFAIINHGDFDLYGDRGVNTLVPIQELRISRAKSGRDIVFLKMDTEHLDSAPYLDPTQKLDRQYEANVYESFGIAPYWIQKGQSSK